MKAGTVPPARRDAPDPDREARFRALYEAHYRAVQAYAMRRSAEPSDVADIVAETFVVAWRRLDDVPAGGEALPWLYGVARRVFANSGRSRRRRRDLHERLAGLAAADVSFEDDIGRDDERRSVLAALARLRPHDQELLRLVTWENLPHRQVAAILGCSENAVAIRMLRARERLAAELAKGSARSGQKSDRGGPRQTGSGGEGHD